MLEEELQKEVQSRIFIHKLAVVGGALMHDYMRRYNTGIKLDPSTVQKQADEYSNRIIQHTLQSGTFDNLYNEVWDILKDSIPENLKLI